jgi:hypothetical protein
MKSDLIDITVSVIHETEKAVLISETGEKDKSVWLPKSLIEIEGTSKAGIIIVTIPEQLAIDKKLI